MPRCNGQLCFASPRIMLEYISSTSPSCSIGSSLRLNSPPLSARRSSTLLTFRALAPVQRSSHTSPASPILHPRALALRDTDLPNNDIVPVENNDSPNNHLLGQIRLQLLHLQRELSPLLDGIMNMFSAASILVSTIKLESGNRCNIPRRNEFTFLKLFQHCLAA